MDADRSSSGPEPTNASPSATPAEPANARPSASPAEPANPQQSGVVFPDTGAGRSTSALGRAIVADALRSVDPIGSRAAEAETSWRRDYRVHFRRLVEA